MYSLGVKVEQLRHRVAARLHESCRVLFIENGAILELQWLLGFTALASPNGGTGEVATLSVE